MNKKTTSPKTVEELTSILKWRLNKPITIDDVERMVKLHIINEEEAKQLLFNEVKEDSNSERIESLKEQVKFLEGVVEKLANKQTFGWINQYTYTPSYPTKYWVTYTSGAPITIGSATTGSQSGIYSMNAVSNTVSLNSSIAQ